MGVTDIIFSIFMLFSLIHLNVLAIWHFYNEYTNVIYKEYIICCLFVCIKLFCEFTERRILLWRFRTRYLYGMGGLGRYNLKLNYPSTWW